MSYPVAYHAAGDGPELHTGDATVTVKCRAADTGGAYELFEVDMPYGALVPPHSEPWAKAFYLLHGRMSMPAGDRTNDLGPGDFVTVPPRTANTLEPAHSVGDVPRLQSRFGMGDFFADIDRHTPRDGSIEDLLPIPGDITVRNHVEFLAGEVPA